jgi:mono/diheme cytochrome c family protein
MDKLFTLIFCTAISNSLLAQNPTWADDVACIVYSHCSGCHNANGSGPFSLMNYTEVKDNASAIESAVTSKVMPPWPNNNAYRKMAHDRTLTE